MMETSEIRPQPGFQELFLSSPADIVIGGAGAGVGKSYAELLEPLRHKDVKGFNAIFFRRTTVQITNPGGLWDESMGLYPRFGAYPQQQKLRWIFKAGSSLKFGHLEHEFNIYDHQGAQYCLIIFDELTHFCLTPETEVLTSTGWKKITDIKKGEIVASLSKEEEIQYKPVTKTFEFEFDGNVRCLKQRNGVSFRATPNHKAVVMKQKQNKDKVPGNRFKGWKFKEVSKLKTCYIPRSGNYLEGKEVEFFHFKRPTNRGHGRNSNSIEKMPMDIWLQYLGWFLAEGSCFKSKNRTGSPIISIRQTRLMHHKELSELHENMGFRWRYRKDGNYLIFSRQLFDVLKPLGNRYQKRVPEFIFTLSKRQQQIFFDAFVNGDGYITPTGGITMGLCNSLLIDDLQRISLHLGMVATKGYQKTKTGFDVFILTISKCSNYNIVRNGQWYDEYYSGNVRCLEVQDNHNFYIRHNGRCCWTGNSKKMFFYLLSRNRSTCGVKPYVRASCNPDAESFVADLIEWWIDQEERLPTGERNPRYGYPIPERIGVIRYFLVDNDNYVWGDTKEEVISKCDHIFNNPDFNADMINPEDLIKSITFIPGSIYENRKLLEKNPEYLGNLMALDEDEKTRLMKGNWKVKIDPLCLFNSINLENMFTNTYPANTSQRYITCDAARFGQDLCTIFVWYGWKVVKLIVLTKCDAQETVDVIEVERERYNIPKGKVIIDQDGLGSGVVKLGRYLGFSGNDRPMEEPGTFIKENYKNRKTQFYYRYADKINNDEVCMALSNENVVIDGQYGVKIKLNGRMYDIRDLIKQHHRAIKKKDPDTDGKKQINSKEEQKIILRGMSPDLSDGPSLRVYFDMKSGELRTGTAGSGGGSLLSKL